MGVKKVIEDTVDDSFPRKVAGFGAVATIATLTVLGSATAGIAAAPLMALYGWALAKSKRKERVKELREAAEAGLDNLTEANLRLIKSGERNEAEIEITIPDDTTTFDSEIKIKRVIRDQTFFERMSDFFKD